MDDAVAGEASKHGVGFGGWGVGRRREGWLGGRTRVGAGDDGWLDDRRGEGSGFGGGVGLGGVGGGFGDWTGTRVGGGGTAHAAVHSLIGEGVGGFVLMAEGVGDFEGFEFGDAIFSFLPEGFEVGGVDFVLALDLFDHEFGVGDDLEAGVVVVEGELEAGEEAGVFGVVVGADAEEF